MGNSNEERRATRAGSKSVDIGIEVADVIAGNAVRFVGGGLKQLWKRGGKPLVEKAQAKRASMKEEKKTSE